MHYKVPVYVCTCALLLSEPLVNAFSSLDFRRMFSGYCPPLENCVLREVDCPHGGYAKDMLGCSVCLCATSPTACEGVQCPRGRHCATINRRAGWFSLRNYKCVPNSFADPLTFLPTPFDLRPDQQTSSSSTTTSTERTTPTTEKTTRLEIKKTEPEITPTTTISSTSTTTTTTTAKTTVTTSATEKLNLPNICPGGAKPGVLCDKDRHCNSDQTCRIYPDLQYGVCCDNEKTRQQDETNEYRFVPRCKQTQNIGPCRSLVPRYFYNKSSGRCEMFIFGGCGNNDNNFRSYSECQQNCENPCELTRQSGRCRAAMARVYYDMKTNRCDMFYFGGCSNEANGNNWDSYEDCYTHCYDHARK